MVDARGALDDITIRRNPVAGADKHHLPNSQRFRRNLARGPVLLNQRRLGDQVSQRPDTVARLVGGDAFQHLADGEQKYDQRRLLSRVDEQGTDSGDGHQHFDGEGHASPQSGKSPSRHRGNTDQAGRNKGPVGDVFGSEQFDRPGSGQQQPGADNQPALAGFIPALAPVGGIIMDMAGRGVAGLVSGNFASALWSLCAPSA